LGFSNSWIAVKGLAPDVAIEELGLEVVSEGHEHPEGNFSLLRLANDWTVVWFESGCEAAFKGPVVKLARHGPAVACGVEDHVMFSEARGYIDGKEAWRVTRDAEASDEIEISGDVPPTYGGLLAAAIAGRDEDENEGVDLLWEVPPDLAQSICGFRHDVIQTDGSTFVELRRARRAAGGGFWRRLFGRG